MQIYVRMCVMRTCMNAYMYKCIPVYLHTCITVYLYTSIRVHVYNFIPVYVYTCILVSLYNCILCCHASMLAPNVCGNLVCGAALSTLQSWRTLAHGQQLQAWHHMYHL